MLFTEMLLLWIVLAVICYPFLYAMGYIWGRCKEGWMIVVWTVLLILVLTVYIGIRENAVHPIVGVRFDYSDIIFFNGCYILGTIGTIPIMLGHEEGKENRWDDCIEGT